MQRIRKGGYAAFVLLPAVLAVFLGTMACTGKKELIPPGDVSGGLADSILYGQTDFRKMTLVKTIPMDGINPWFSVGDVLGSREQEIVLLNDSSIAIRNGDGSKVSERDFEGFALGKAITGDVNGDNKDDIVVGFFSDKSVRLMGLSGTMDVLFDSTFEEAPDGETVPHFIHKGKIYFTAGSRHNISPKAVGVWDSRVGGLSWYMHIGPVPLGLSFDPASDLLAVSNRAASRERKTNTIRYDVPGERHALLLLDGAGSVRLKETVGAAANEGIPVEDALSGLTLKLIDVNGDGTGEIMALGNKISELYGGRTFFQVRGLDGSLLREMAGPEETEGTFGFFRKGNNAAGILLAWSRTGGILLLDEDLNVKKEITLPGDLHDARIRKIATIEGMSSPGFLLTDRDKVYLLDENLDVLFSTAVRGGGIVKADLFAGSGGKASIAVLSDSLYLFAEGGEDAAALSMRSNPAGADLFIDGRGVPAGELPCLYGLEPGRHEVRALVEGREKTEIVTLWAGQVTDMTVDVREEQNEAVAEAVHKGELINYGNMRLSPVPPVPLNDWTAIKRKKQTPSEANHYLVDIADFTGGPEAELLFAEIIGERLNKISLKNPDFKTVSSFSPGGNTQYGIKNIGDADGDGKADLLTIA